MLIQREAAAAVKGTVVFVVNSDRAFLTHRSSWALSYLRAGHAVLVVSPDTGYADRITQLGMSHLNIDLGRETISPLLAAGVVVRLLSLMLRIRPNLVFLVQTAAYTLGWPAAVLLPRCVFIRVAGGKGRALGLEGESRGTSARVVRIGLWLSSRLSNVWSLFQLVGDQHAFVSQALARGERSAVIPGTGIDVSDWPASGRSFAGRLRIGFASRLYAEKGVREFARSASLLSATGNSFVIIGAPDQGVSSAVTADEIEGWVSEGIVEWWGQSDNMPSTLACLDLLVLPSTHPEGTPRILIEAAASGLPIIASEQEGCRAVVEHEVTGWILTSTDPTCIAQTITRALEDRDLLVEMSRAARTLAEDRFSLDSTLLQLDQLVERAGGPRLKVPEPRQEEE